MALPEAQALSSLEHLGTHWHILAAMGPWGGGQHQAAHIAAHGQCMGGCVASSHPGWAGGCDPMGLFPSCALGMSAPVSFPNSDGCPLPVERDGEGRGEAGR